MTGKSDELHADREVPSCQERPAVNADDGGIDGLVGKRGEFGPVHRAHPDLERVARLNGRSCRDEHLQPALRDILATPW